MRLLVLIVAIAAAAFGAVDGAVQNATNGSPQQGAVITLVELGGGMNNVGSTKSDAQGRFHFDADLKAGTPYLIQALHEGVTYNRVLPPGTPSTGVSISVYEAARKVPEAKVSQDMILLERSGDELVVNETVIYTNSGNTTYQDPGGTLSIEVPPAATGAVRMRITAPQGMPITREPVRGREPNTWVVQYPIKPGETRIDFSYSMPAGDNTVFQSRILHGGGPVRFVAPAGVKLESPALTDLGPEPRTKASVYELKGTQFAIRVSGSGQLRAAADSGGTSENSGEASGGEGDSENSPGVQFVKPLMFRRIPMVVGLIAGMLAIGFVFLYSRGSSA